MPLVQGKRTVIAFIRDRPMTSTVVGTIQIYQFRRAIGTPIAPAVATESSYRESGRKLSYDRTFESHRAAQQPRIGRRRYG